LTNPILIQYYATLIYIMKLYEFEGIELFRNAGIPVPAYALASNPEEAREKAIEIGMPVVIKAQVLTGGRYLAGGVRFAESPDEVISVARQIFKLTIGDLPVDRVMVARKIETAQEYYLGITVDGYHGTPTAILSLEGGVSINKIAQERPEVLVSKRISISQGLTSSDARSMCREAGLRGQDLTELSSSICSLYNMFRKNDALLAEINPLVRTVDGDYLAMDAKVEIDDSSMYRHADLGISMQDHIPSPLERKAREIGVSYVELDGDIAIIASGAGLGMASVDTIARTMRPANFLETGGGITADLLYKVMDLVLQKSGIRAVFINIYGGINPIHEGAKGVVKYMQEHNITIPVVAKALGNHQEETWEIFEQHGVHVVKEVSTEKGVELLAHLLGEKG
jgi:succinyl-CoA synthetase beta subunit